MFYFNVKRKFNRSPLKITYRDISYSYIIQYFWNKEVCEMERRCKKEKNLTQNTKNERIKNIELKLSRQSGKRGGVEQS